MMRHVALAAVVVVVSGSPTAALAASYVVLSVDKTTLTMTDLRSPRLTNGRAQTYAVAIYRTPTKIKGKPAGRTADYLIVQTDFDCAKSKQQQQYSAAYNAAGGFASSDLTKRPWSKVKPGSTDEQLKNLGCSAAKPTMGFALGDVRVGKVMTDYRAGLYDRRIH